MYSLQSFTFIIVFFREILDLAPIFYSQKRVILRSLVKKSIPDWHLFITQIETKWTKWYAMTLHLIAYRLLELLFGTHTFHIYANTLLIQGAGMVIKIFQYIQCRAFLESLRKLKLPLTGMRKFRIDQDFLIEHWHMIYIIPDVLLKFIFE